ncbi:MAG TPA: FecR domain-containing protein [Steroidobacteraceae bacterium]|nr:FecR domain-containing protein [Steroidobacteraceae bacterium]
MSAADRIEQEASRWLATRDAGAGAPGQSEEFNAWLEADIRHRVTYLRLEANWQRVERLRDLRPLDRGVNRDLLKERKLRRPWPLAAAAGLGLALVVGGLWLYQQNFSWQHYETRVGGFARAVLDDGSVIDLNTNSEVRVRIGATRREVRLIRGEGRFQVAHDTSRPFTVSAAGAAVRAVGTAFTVRLHDSARVDVLVSEGKVAIVSANDSGRVPRAPPLGAGEAAVVVADRISVSRVEPQQLERRLAWTSGRLQFRGESLGEAVVEFNRYNRRQLRLADASLESLRVGGNFAATDPESFAAALASTFNLRVVPEDADAIVLRPP